MQWNRVSGIDQIQSPGLLVAADLVQQNIQRMIEIVGGHEHVGRLVPHVKTHKMPAVMAMQIDAGITHFKAATLAEAKMIAKCSAASVLLAHQPVGPKLLALGDLIKQFPNTQFGAIVDDASATEAIDRQIGSSLKPLDIFIDIDCGMHRTGIPLGPRATQLLQQIESLPGLRFAGLHVYDGHVHDAPLDARRKKTGDIIASVNEFIASNSVPQVIAGGSPTFGIWASETQWHCSPGTTVFWDHGYGSSFPDLGFEIATALLARVISKPQPGQICLDLGHKAIAAEMPLEKRAIFPDLTDARPVGQSEEHFVIATETADSLAIGDAVIAIPRHICPTVALHRMASVIRSDRVTGESWEVTARDR